MTRLLDGQTYEWWQEKATRWTAGTTIDETIQTVQAYNQKEYKVIINSIAAVAHDQKSIDQVRDLYMLLLNAIHERRVNAGITVRLTNIGIGYSFVSAKKALKEVLQKAHRQKVDVEIDMEERPFVEDTIKLITEILEEGHSLRQCVQAGIKDIYPHVLALQKKGGERLTFRIVTGSCYKETLELSETETIKQYYRLMMTCGKRSAIGTNITERILCAKANQMETQILLGFENRQPKHSIDTIYACFGDWKTNVGIRGYIQRREKSVSS